jgi:hypothetical protein
VDKTVTQEGVDQTHDGKRFNWGLYMTFKPTTKSVNPTETDMVRKGVLHAKVLLKTVHDNKEDKQLYTEAKKDRKTGRHQRPYLPFKPTATYT